MSVHENTRLRNEMRRSMTARILSAGVGLETPWVKLKNGHFTRINKLGEVEVYYPFEAKS
jgi:hypothetical protein